MRIIAGTVGGRRLKAPRGQATRPTADRVREAIFNILAARGPVPERVLDLYACSGALGRLLDEDGLVIAEHEWRAAPKDEHESLALLDRRRYGQTAVSFFTSRSRHEGATT